MPEPYDAVRPVTNYGTAITTGSSWTISYPAGTVEGDLIAAYLPLFTWNGGGLGGSAETELETDGWYCRGQQNVVGMATQHGIMWRYATADDVTDGGYTFGSAYQARYFDATGVELAFVTAWHDPPPADLSVVAQASELHTTTIVFTGPTETISASEPKGNLADSSPVHRTDSVWALHLTSNLPDSVHTGNDDNDLVDTSNTEHAVIQDGGLWDQGDGPLAWISGYYADDVNTAEDGTGPAWGHWDMQVDTPHAEAWVGDYAITIGVNREQGPYIRNLVVDGVARDDQDTSWHQTWHQGDTHEVEFQYQRDRYDIDLVAAGLGIGSTQDTSIAVDPDPADWFDADLTIGPWDDTTTNDHVNAIVLDTQSYSRSLFSGSIDIPAAPSTPGGGASYKSRRLSVKELPYDLRDQMRGLNQLGLGQ